ncbi:MAG: substrate-binding domain-containing protein [Lacrimispora sp.]|uniref:sugar ABC transporter substrate-binding protein n=1 Tax=Lacrimispora sp. TaxID=2719234 RepID=UPI0039E35646
MRRKIIAMILAGVAALSLVACGSAAKSEGEQGKKSDAAVGEQTPGKEPYVIWVNPLVGSAVFTSADNGIKDASKEFGFKLKIIGPSVLDDTQMYEALQNALVENPDLVVTTPYNFSAVQGLYTEAKEKGIPIINISSDSDEAGRVSFIGTDNTAYGQLAADYINEEKNGKANVMIMMANLDTSNQLEQKTAFEEKCKKEYPGINVVLTDEDKGDSVTALQKFQDNLKAHPEIDTILCLEAIGGVSAANAIEELGMKDITILAIDDNEDTLQYIRDGKVWGTMAQNFYKMGYTAGEFARDYLEGKKVDSIVDSGTVLITKDNIDTYQDEFYKK